jgi:hypothetical protein
MSEYNKIITIEIHAFGTEKEPCDIVPIMLKITKDIIDRGGYISAPCSQMIGLHVPNYFFMTLKSTCPLPISQSSILKYHQEVQLSKSIKRNHLSGLTTVLTKIHGFLVSIQQRILHYFWG